MRLPLLSLACACTLAAMPACAAPKPAPLPQYTALTTQGRSVAARVAQAQADGKAVRALQLDALSLLDRLDAKATQLLER